MTIEQDARRYKWIRSRIGTGLAYRILEPFGDLGDYLRDEELDAEIDRALWEEGDERS